MDSLIKLISDYSKLSKEDQELFVTVITRRHVTEKKENDAIVAFKKALEEHSSKEKNRPPFIGDTNIYPGFPKYPTVIKPNTLFFKEDILNILGGYVVS